MNSHSVYRLVLLLVAFGGIGQARADMQADSPVTFPKEGALPAKYPPDEPAKATESPEKDYSIFSTPERSLAQIAKIQAEMPAGQFDSPPQDWKPLARTRRILIDGGELRILALGDSIVNDIMRSGWVAKLREEYPKARINATVYVRGGGGCQHYKAEGRIAKNVVPRKPDLVFIGGISQSGTDDIREVIHQLRAALPEVEILLATGAFGTTDPRDRTALAKATGAYAKALKTLAADERCAYLDMSTPWSQYIRSSKLHPHLFYRDVVHSNEYGEQILSKIMMAFWATHGFQIAETADRITLRGVALEASIRKKGYVSGVEGGSFVDKKSGGHDLGYGLDIQDWIMEPGSDAAYRSQLRGDLPYDFGNSFHGKTPKRSIEGPQICTQAKELSPHIIQGQDFVAIEQSWNYRIAAPGKETGSGWRQTLVFPSGKRYFISADRILSRNSGDALFFRQDMPGHIKHDHGNNFSEIYLSYRGRIPAAEFNSDFAPDEKFNYQRERDGVPQRMIRAYHTRDPKTGADGPWLAGMTLNPADVMEAWCHQRGYVCLIEEIGGRPIKPGQSFGAAYIVGWFDSIEEMEKVYDHYRDQSRLEVTTDGWRLLSSH